MLAVKVNDDGLVSRAAVRSKGAALGSAQSDTLSSVDLNEYDPYVGDLDGDGAADLLIVAADADGLKVRTALGVGNGTFAALSGVETLSAANTSYSGYSVWVRDVDNDGRGDLIVSKAGVSTTDGIRMSLGVALSEGDGTFGSLTLGAYPTNFTGILFGDVDGDRLLDAVAFQSVATALATDVFLGAGNGAFGATAIESSFITDGVYSPLLADLNDDGIDDLVSVWIGSEGLYAETALGTGDGAFLPDSNGWGHYTTLTMDDSSAYADWSVGDVNGDGYRDLMFAAATSTGLSVRAARGQGDGTFETAVTTSAVLSSTDVSAYRVRATDADGDGLTDVVATLPPDSSGFRAYTALASGSRPDVITRIVDGFGVDTGIAYAELSDTGVHTLGTAAVYPARDFADARRVVNSIETDDGAGGRRTYTYAYEGARQHRQGRGWLGFAAVERTDTEPSPDLVTRTQYRQDFPYIGLASSISMRLAGNNRLLSRLDATFGRIETVSGKKTEFPYVDTTTTRVYDLAAALTGTQTLISTTVRDQDYIGALAGTNKTYGNQSSEKVTRSRGSVSYVTHTAYEYDDVPASWLLGRVDKETVTEYLSTHTGATNGACSASTCAQRVTEWSYNASKWLITEQVIEPNVAKWKLDTDYTYDKFGNVALITVSGGLASAGTNIVSRSTDPGYDTRGQFPITFDNAEDHTERFAWDGKFGVVTKRTDPNNAATSWSYDGFGRVTMETRPDGSKSETVRAWCTAATCPKDGVMKVLVKTDGAPAEAIVYDRLGRETLRAQAAWTADTATSAGVAVIDTEYDSLGRVKRRSRPYLSGGTAVWFQYTYDQLGRVRTETAPGNRRTATAYSQLQTTVTNPKSQSTIFTRDVRGYTVSVRDAASKTTAYGYHAFGNLARVTDASNNAIVNTFNIRGFRESIADPDAGTTTFKYNALGELIEQTDAKGQSITFDYDLIGRMTERDDIEGAGGVTAWTYDSATKGTGRIHTIVGAEGDNHRYSYDTHGRLSLHRTTIDSTNYDVGYTYDSAGRLATLRYPSSSQYSSGLTVSYDYTQEGQLKSVRNTDGNELFWQITGANAAGQLTGESFGNSVDTARTFDANTGFLTGIESGYTTATDRQDEAYAWDALGNLTRRQDQRQNLTETFTYDSLNRLTRSAVGSTAKTYAYDALGNLTRKSDVSATSFTYGTQATGCTRDPGPHAVSVAGGEPFCYDANGNMTKGYNFRSDTARTYAWTPYNKPSQIVEGTATLSFSYGADRSRFRQVNSASGVTTLYIDGLFE
ncbi:MAG: FG-GAP-like repeat-containing protein, partial [Rhodospirillales bacterium]|nr:FG-GAP-like repeat-containing protein [Rhodospirillales bacterium]